ncbi:glycine cleavage system aminomethyltransferase GcvT [candidate division WOR-3 bacterium]|nr:glycine cleavage system aminomethyltransferase GcvT [candidate division WOR-3 bacterium]
MQETELKTTPFYSEHVKAGAKIVPFAGYKMPIQYPDGIVSESLNVRTTAGLFDVSHMGEIEIKGRECLDSLNFLVTNDVSKLSVNGVLYTAMCYENGGIVDDLLVYRLEDHFLLVVNASNIDKDFEWIMEKLKGFDIEISNRSDETAQLALQGPVSEKIMKKVLDADYDSLGFYQSFSANIDKTPVLISRTGYTGEDGFEIYSPADKSDFLWQKILGAGEKYSICPVGLAARDVLRLEMCYCLYGNDISAQTTPLEAGLGWVVKLDKPDFIGREALLTQKQNGFERRLVHFVLDGKNLSRKGFPLVSEGEQIGEVTSGAFSPILGKSVGMGYVKTGFHKINTRIGVEIRSKICDASVTKPPFYKNATHK